MARRDRSQSEKAPRVRRGTQRDELLSGVDFVWKSGSGSLSKGLTLRAATAEGRAADSRANVNSSLAGATYKR